uniref:Membrane transporter protein n=1 Tax=Angiostrongylus cantonensis TaxID=6313 RepID=A0A0K0CVF8_ANGCA
LTAQIERILNRPSGTFHLLAMMASASNAAPLSTMCARARENTLKVFLLPLALFVGSRAIYQGIVRKILTGSILMVAAAMYVVRQNI